MGSDLKGLARIIRYFILVSTTEAGSGHPTSSLSAVELMVVLMFGGFFKGDDRLIFSKGHAAPLLYSIYAAAGKITEKELLTLRKFGSRLEGHPTMVFPFTEAATGSLGQGLSIGVGTALSGKYLDKTSFKTYVLLGDSEMAEGSVWEAIQLGAFYKLDNLVGILDVNRLGQRGETMYGHGLEEYGKRVEAFGWGTILVGDGHNLDQIKKAFNLALAVKGKPVMVIAKTIKGKGVSFLEDREGWHGKALSEEELKKTIKELGKVDLKLKGEIAPPKNVALNSTLSSSGSTRGSWGNETMDSRLRGNDIVGYNLGDMVATRKAYGNALVRIFQKFPEMVVLDAEVSNSTYSEIFKKEYPQRFFEMFIAEQNMVGVALGLSRMGKIPFISTFSAFFTRAYDQIRMSQYSDANIKFVGSHAGVSIGEDGPSQMGLEDIAMFRTLLNSVVLYPSDGVSTERLVEEMAKHKGNVYLRTTRMETPVIYPSNEKFLIGGSKVHLPHTSEKYTPPSSRGARDEGSLDSKVAIIAAGVTLHEALKAQQELANDGIEAIVLDLYSIKPIDEKTLKELAIESKAIITVEDHFAQGGLGEAVESALSETGIKICKLSVTKIPKSGKPSELLNYEGIDAKTIVKKVKEVFTG